MLLILVAVYASIEMRTFFPKGSDPRELMKLWHFMLGLSVLTLVSIRAVIHVIGPSPDIQPVPPKWQSLLAQSMHILLFLDSDDYFFPGSLDAIRARCDATNPDLVMFDYARVYWNGRKARNMLGGLLEGHPEPVVLSEVPDLLKIINIATNKAYRRVFLEENDLWSRRSGPAAGRCRL